MHKFIAALFGLLSAGCSGIKVPDDFAYKEIETRDFKLASWQKISEPDGVYKFYIEGDGHAFDSRGRPTADPTPQGTMLRELAFGDPSPNVIYLARPCQYIMSPICAKRHWTTARFAPEVINAEYDAVRQTAGGHEVILVGFSGGAQVAGLISAAKPGPPGQKAGNHRRKSGSAGLDNISRSAPNQRIAQSGKLSPAISGNSANPLCRERRQGHAGSAD